MLTAIGEPAVDPLIQALSEKDPEMVWRYVVILGNIGHARAVQPLLDAMNTENPKLRYLAAEALDQIGAPSVTPLIKEIINVTSEIESTTSLVFFNPIVKKRWAFKQLASEVLLNIGEPAVVPLIDSIKQKDVVGKTIAVDLLERIGSQAVEALINALGDDDPEVQAQASEVLIKIGAPSVEPLIDVLEGDFKTVYSKSDLDPFWRALMILGEIQDHRAVKALISTLFHEESFIRLLAVEALEKIGDETAIGSLVGELSDWPVRYRAARALETLGWKPASSSDRIRYLIGKGDKAQVMLQSVIVRKTLLEDLYAGHPRRMEYAVHAFVNLWGPEAISDLIVQLNQNGNLAMAESFANAGYDRLREAAENWAESHGYDLSQEKF
jgi:HEAT repeat protein